MYIKLPEKASYTGNGAKKPRKAKKPGFDCGVYSAVVKVYCWCYSCFIPDSRVSKIPAENENNFSIHL